VLLAIGSAVGALAGYAGGRIDNALMRVVDVVLAFPDFFLLLIVAAYSGVTVVTLILFIGLFNGMYLARLVRAEFLVLRPADYVAAARATGVGGWRIIGRHMLPNALAPIIVNATVSIATAMYIEVALDVLGVGLPAATPTWGTMLAASEQYMAFIPLQTIAPGLALLLAILAINIVGDGLRDALDPRVGF
jgi:peptide/nickel transport system permease protein